MLQDEARFYMESMNYVEVDPGHDLVAQTIKFQIFLTADSDLFRTS